MPLTRDELTFFATPTMLRYLSTLSRPSHQLTALQAISTTAGYLNDPGCQPSGLGQWSWLQNGHDDVLAYSRGYRHPADVEIARSQGIFSKGNKKSLEPHTVWIPDSRYLNPKEQPGADDEGRFEFLTTGDREMCVGRFEGDVVFAGAVDRGRPSAREVFEVRWDLRMDGREGEDPTEGVDIVWVPFLEREGEEVEGGKVVRWLDVAVPRDRG